MELRYGELNLIKGNRRISAVTRIGDDEIMLGGGIHLSLLNLGLEGSVSLIHELQNPLLCHN